jgi:hypothetical protein
MIRVAQNLQPYFTLSSETPPTWRVRFPIYIPQEQGGPVVPPALCSLHVASCDSQGYGGGILTLPQPGGPSPHIYIYIFLRNRIVQSKIKSQSHVMTDGHSISLFHPNEFQSIRRCTLRRNLWCYDWESSMWSMQWNVEFGYQLNIGSRTKENHGKSWSSWPVAGPSGYKLTSSQQSGMKYASPNIIPYLCFLFSFLSFFFENICKLLLQKLYLYIIWISTKPYVTSAEVMNAYIHNYAYKYTYIYNCNSLIIGKFGSSLYFAKKKSGFTRGLLVIQYQRFCFAVQFFCPSFRHTFQLR